MVGAYRRLPLWPATYRQRQLTVSIFDTTNFAVRDLARYSPDVSVSGKALDSQVLFYSSPIIPHGKSRSQGNFG